MPTPRASRSVYLGLFLITLATIMYEIALTRIFSVATGYHEPVLLPHAAAA